MKTITTVVATLIIIKNLNAQNTAPSLLSGHFTDDYNIRYQINDTLWTQLPGTTYHIIKWNITEQYLIALNDSANKTDKGLYTRIDYMSFKNMDPYTWGFCLTAYHAATAKEAENTPAADRENPRKGCGGYPFSRMKIKEEVKQ